MTPSLLRDKAIGFVVLLALLQCSCASQNYLPVTPGPPVVDLSAPPMGFMSWERFRCEVDCEHHPNDCINESLYMQMAEALVDGGYVAAGYKQISIDDCWSAGRDPESGALLADPARFPSGMKALGDFLHKRGLKFGLYSDVGDKTCGGYEGSLGHEDLDARTFASWGVDYLKMDGCYLDRSHYEDSYTKFGVGLKKAAETREIIYSCSWPAYIGDSESAKPFSTMYSKAGCNTWRNWHDIDNTWDSLQTIIMHWADFWEVLGRIPNGSFNDADMLIIGDDHHGQLISPDKARLQLSFWAMIASPLFIGGDVRTIPGDYRDILLNKHVISINQDVGRHQADCVVGCKGTGSPPLNESSYQQVWSKDVNGGASHVLGFFNINDHTIANITGTQVISRGSSLDRCVDLWAPGPEANLCKRMISPSIDDVWVDGTWHIQRVHEKSGVAVLHITAVDVPPTTQRMIRFDWKFHEDFLESSKLQKGS